MSDERRRGRWPTGRRPLRLPRIREVIDTDIAAAYAGDPAAKSADEVLICYPGVVAVIHYRLAHELYLLGARLVARIISEVAHSATGIDIHPGAQIGESFFIDHGTGVVIGETAIIARGVRIYQAVTLGAKRFAVDENGALVKDYGRHPIVEDDVVIYAGATILGRITIGKGSTIGGNVWLTHGVPPGSNIAQAETRSEAFDGGCPSRNRSSSSNIVRMIATAPPAARRRGRRFRTVSTRPFSMASESRGFVAGRELRSCDLANLVDGQPQDHSDKPAPGASPLILAARPR